MMKKTLCTLVVASLFLQGCAAPIVVGAAAIGGGMAYDKRSGIQRLYDDTDIGNQTTHKITHDPELAGSHIDLAVSHGNVLLAGQTPSPTQRIKAERLVASVPGVRKIYNQITIAGPTSRLTRSSDSWITTKVKSTMLLEKSLKALSIKVVTENGVVYLMGTVTHSQADLATEVARQMNGVQKVIRLFEYV